MQLTVHVKPNARENKIEQIAETEFCVWVTATPEKGKANKTVLKLLAKHLKIPFSSLSVVHGSKGKKKESALISVCNG